jgi:hypothetical protein
MISIIPFNGARLPVFRGITGDLSPLNSVVRYWRAILSACRRRLKPGGYEKSLEARSRGWFRVPSVDFFDHSRNVLTSGDDATVTLVLSDKT